MAKPVSDSHSNREAVQATNDDASASKLSCVKKGYMKDDYVHCVVRRPVRRSPIINRGYFARWAALRKLLNQFLDTEKMGVKRDEGRAPHLYVELDFKEVTSKKTTLIETCNHLRDKISATASISQECVLIYLDPDSSRAIVGWTSKAFSTAIFFLYEQIHPDDAFGQQMIRNLEAKEKLFLDQGWQRAVAWDMLKVYSNFVEAQERRRIERLELFDEFEEWYMMQEHYCVAYAINDAMGLFEDFGFPNNQQKQQQQMQNVPNPSSTSSSSY
ncbi:tRNA wybutosine-synthesizing protein 4 [Prunus yedoensis var. nudiflora]|uniref:Leucine carboxyl methyltransferase 1 homolog n=1 Tax=Prunus yedoensis var. nudiflora TaxID=2094558 RepID=A0A314UE43_PRUYE|nr:tRNA wybutosine-synthesizing protein 4 [Prunus yedoensis var. nudiflora]